MDFEKRFQEITEFLRPHARMWQNEIMDLYPEQFDCFPQEWIKTLDSLSNEELWQVDCLSDFSLLPACGLKEWMHAISELSIIEQYDYGELENLPDWAFNKVKGKKRHEILVLANFFKEKMHQDKFSHLVDIGGGVGHLARVMAHYKGIPCISLDINPDFHHFGKIRLEKYPKPPNASEVTFITHDFTHELEGKRNKEIFSNTSYSLGLHTCGPLANRHIKVATQNSTKGLINFGCCYNKLNPRKDINLSKIAKEIGLELHGFSCTLATRGHSSMDLEGFKLKRRVKSFRYALDFILKRKLGHKEFFSVGEASAKEYWGNFADYVLKKLDQHDIAHNLSADEIEQFYTSAQIQEELDLLFKANIIRWQLGRLLEIYILLDRVLLLKEKGHNPKLAQFFDHKISPRNLAIYL